MLNRTHLAVGCFFMLLFLPSVLYKGAYVTVYLIASILPNIDAILSGKRFAPLLPLRLFFKHRGYVHSFTFCFLITFVLVWFWPIGAFPFFLGFSLHVLLDAWTPEGVAPFWPMKKRSTGKVENGSKIDNFLFFMFVIADVIAIYFVAFK